MKVILSRKEISELREAGVPMDRIDLLRFLTESSGDERLSELVNEFKFRGDEE